MKIDWFAVAMFALNGFVFYDLGRWVRRRTLAEAHRREMRENVMLRLMCGIPINLSIPPEVVSRAIAAHVAGHPKGLPS